MTWNVIYITQNNPMREGLLLSFHYRKKETEVLQAEMICLYFHSKEIEV